MWHCGTHAHNAADAWLVKDMMTLPASSPPLGLLNGRACCIMMKCCAKSSAFPVELQALQPLGPQDPDQQRMSPQRPKCSAIAMQSAAPAQQQQQQQQAGVALTLSAPAALAVGRPPVSASGESER